MSSVHERDASLQRHESLYFDDGDIVLTTPIESRLERKSMVFRIDKVFLARHSRVFRDMFSFTPGQDLRDIYDGVPRVDLADDAESMQGLLSAMYNAATLPLGKFNPHKPFLLMGTMRLAIKYEVDGVRDMIKRSVEEDWPHDHLSYETWSADRSRVVKVHGQDWWRHFPEPAAAMQFATEFGCPTILTGIVYYMSTLSDADRIRLPTTPHIVRWNLLNSANFFRIWRVQDAVKWFLSEWDDELSERLLDLDCCQNAINRVYKDNIRYDCLHYTNSHFLEMCRAEGTCSECLEMLDYNSIYADGCKGRLWTRLSKCVTASPVPWPAGIDKEEQTDP